jgi:hypothetical protein
MIVFTNDSFFKNTIGQAIGQIGHNWAAKHYRVVTFAIIGQILKLSKSHIATLVSYNILF